MLRLFKKYLNGSMAAENYIGNKICVPDEKKVGDTVIQ